MMRSVDDDRRPDDSFLFGYFFARRHATRWNGRARTRPTMPSRAWWSAALTVTAVGALIGVALALGLGWNPLRWAVIVGIVGFGGGMYVVETIWERRVAEVGSQPDGPIGPRG